MNLQQPDGSSEDRKLDRAMQSIDPMLKASLQRDQQRQRRRILTTGGLVVGLIVAAIVIAGNADLSVDSADGAEGPVEGAARASDLAREAWALWKQGDGAAAEKRFEQATKLDPANANLWNGLGWARMSQQDYDEAMKAFQKSIREQPNHPAAVNGMGQAELARGNLDAAETWFRKVYRKAPAARFGLATVLLLKREYREALPVLNQLKDTGELDPRLLADMKTAATKQHLPEELRRRLSPAALPNTDQARSAAKANAKGWQFFNSGKPRPAELAFRQALELQPDFPAAENGLGFSLLNQGKAADALPLFERLVKQDPQHAGYINGLARSQFALGDSDKAIETWRSGDTKQVTAITWGLARALTDAKRFDEALTYWQRIAKVSPNDKSVEAMIENCSQ